MRNKIHINITLLYITILGKDILKTEQNYDIVKTINRYLTHLEYPCDPIAEFTFTKDKSDFLLPVCESLFLHIKEICKHK